MNKGTFPLLEKLFLTGDYKQFTSIYNDLKKPISDGILFLALQVFHNTENGEAVKKTHDALKRSESHTTRVRAELSSGFHSFIEEKLTKSEGNSICAKCKLLAEQHQGTGLAFFATSTKIKVKFALLNQGLIDADCKDEIIEEGLELYKAYKNILGKETSSFLLTLINHTTAMPKADLKKGIKLIDDYLLESEKSSKDRLYDTSFYLKKTQLELKTIYYDRFYDPTKLPDFVENSLKKIENRGYLAAKARIFGIYGSHLLQLELIEGIEWLAQAILLFWELDHRKDAYIYENNCLKWLQERHQAILLNDFKKTISLPENSNNRSISQEINILNKAHQYFAESDYYASEKILKDTLEELTTEGNKIHFINLLANSASKIKLDNKDLLTVIDEALESLSPVKNSILTAQLYSFKAILDKNRAGDHFAKTIGIFKTLDSTDEVVTQLTNRFIHSAQEQKGKKEAIFTKDTIADLEEADAYLLDKKWIKNRYSLRGKLFQTYAFGLLLERQFDKALKFLKEALQLFEKAGHLGSVATNAHHLGSILIELGRAQKDIHFYEEANKHALNALKILETGSLIDFIWRLEFQAALSYSEALQRNLVKEDQISFYRTEAEKYFKASLFTAQSRIKKTGTLETSRNLEAAINLQRDIKQLISSGFYFFFNHKRFKDCIEWLENVRAKSLLYSIANNIKPDPEISDHLLLAEEHKILEAISSSSSIQEQRKREKTLGDLYDKMIEDRALQQYAKKKTETIPSFNEVISAIKQDEKKLKGEKLFFLYYYIHQDRLYAFGINSDNSEPLLFEISISVPDLREEILTFSQKMSMARFKDFRPEESFWTQFSALIEPLETWTKPGDIICIIPYGILQNLPFHALLLDKKPLIMRNPVFYNSSLTSWEYLQSKTKEEDIFKKAFVFGDPELDLKESVEEVETISRIFNTKPIVGKEAHKKKFTDALDQASFIHFAGHGVFDENRGFLSGLSLYNNELVTAEEIMNRNNIASFIVLSSCDTGRQKNHPGEESIGLIPSFLAAGASTVMAGLWHVKDKDAKDFFQLFYKKISQGIPKVIAYQQSMIELMKRPERAHFYHWAMFSLNGEWQ
ncbi:CHAT domain-containing protein [Leptobacterium flavescens]|uniref:CHAT domain-containing protein n=1 Tax=Leptobacterium flavescens TaxID=472055 RepID=A0A6P0UK18_9FLAO|nr:CHAT domain-containing tetratricopeptide repeat protein [Leptobacterium flavescens]NER12892.1 CHAT domain-containing protein [Leptobacterium flavescens]